MRLFTFIAILASFNFIQNIAVADSIAENEKIILPKDRNNTNVRIIGGEEAAPNAYPYQVGMYIVRSAGVYFCGGSLIAPDTVLTAAHCVDTAISAYVFLGYHNVPAYSSVTTADNIIHSTEFDVHEDYTGFTDQEFEHDIAIVHLPTNVTLSDTIATIPIDGSNSTHAGEIALVSGWGITQGGQSGVESALRFVEDEIMTNEECSAATTQLTTILRDTHICLSYKNSKGVCSGDSGGPLALDGVLIGVVSFGPSTCQAVIPSGFARVSSYYDWIMERCPGCRSGATSIDIRTSYIYFMIISSLVAKHYLFL